ncbi:MAG: hypothetical protein M1821_005622 [Bathelium mastoideum]|nr:MAG: hypothetical protein M1821_005622 [Bathelium mastoideum]
MATICGRVFNFRRQFMAEYGGQGLNPAFYQQHQSVNALLADRLQILSGQVASSQGHPNPILMFLAITAYMAIFMLCETIESKQLIPGSPEAALASSRQRSLDGAGELGMLITILSQFNHFETHPFTPISLLLSARFCLSRIELDDSYAALMPLITSALQSLTNVNGLAKNFLRLLDHQLPSTY